MFSSVNKSSSSCSVVGQFRGRYYPTRVSMQFQKKQIMFPSLRAVGTRAVARKGLDFVSKNTRPLFVCNAALVGSYSCLTRQLNDVFLTL